MIDRAVCLFKGHDVFHFSGDSTMPSGYRSWWCGRCGHKSNFIESLYGKEMGRK